jgi:hypothetical protein
VPPDEDKFSSEVGWEWRSWWWISSSLSDWTDKLRAEEFVLRRLFRPRLLSPEEYE